ncbi:MAG: hypothetical protein ABSG57_03835 [Candidatus Bathyarchaeia archaeon]
MSLILGLLSIIVWQIVAVLIAVSLGIPSLVLNHERLKLEVTTKPKEGGKEQVTLEKKDTPLEGTILVSPKGGYSYEFEYLAKGDHIKGEIVSTERIDIYFVDNINFDKWNRDVGFDFRDCNEDVLETKIDYSVSKKGTWYVLIENNGRKVAKVKVHLSEHQGQKS